MTPERWGEITAVLAGVLESQCQEPASTIVDSIFVQVNQFVGSMEAFDDQTVAVLKIKESTTKK